MNRSRTASTAGSARSQEKTVKKTRRGRDPDAKGDPAQLDWTPMLGAFKDALEWSLDVAVALARDYPEEVEAVERVRRFMRSKIAGQTAHVSIDDVLFVFALVIGAIERDLGTVGHFGSWLGVHALHFPGAPQTDAHWIAQLLASLNRPPHARVFA